MDTAVLAARVVLAAVFCVAAVGKLLDLSGARAALFGFGVSRRVANLAGPLIPLAELAAATSLVIQPAARWGGAAAVALLLAFLAGIANALARGQAPNCHCFGIFHSSRAGPSAIYRNAALAAVAGFVVVAGPGESLDAWVSDHSVAELLAVVFGAVAVLAVADAVRMRRRTATLGRELVRRSEALGLVPPGLPAGAVAPAFDLPAVWGGRLTSESLRARGKPVLLVFMEPGCVPCAEIGPSLARWQATLTERMTIATITAEGSDPEEYAKYGIVDIGLQRDLDLSTVYRVHGMPSAVLVSRDGRIDSSLASGANAIEALVRLTVRREAASAGNGAQTTSAKAAESA